MSAAFRWLAALCGTSKASGNRVPRDQYPPAIVDHSPPQSALVFYKREILRVLQRRGCSDLRTLERGTGIRAETLVGPALDLGVEGKLTVEWRYVRRRFGRLKEYLSFTHIESLEQCLSKDSLPEFDEGLAERPVHCNCCVSARTSFGGK